MVDTQPPKKNWPVILTLVISALGSIFFAAQAFILGVFWLISILDPTSGIAEGLPIGLLFWTSILGGVLLVPLLVSSLNQLRGRPFPSWLDLKTPALAKLSRWVILAWPLVVLLGWLVARQEIASMVLLGPINLLVAGIPILWIYQAAQRELYGGTPIRKWRIFGFSIAILPLIIIVVELLALVALGVMGVIWLGIQMYADPGLEQQLYQLAEQVSLMGEDVESVLDFIRLFLLQPGVIFWALAIFGGIIPIIEEVVKPAALWSLAGRRITPQEGFVGGLLCGAGFALMENVFYFTNVILAEDWLFMAIGRAGTGVLHMLASGLLGWGLARAWRDGRWGFLGLTTLAAFILHGLWNVLAVVSGLVPLLVLEVEPTLNQMLLSHFPVVLLMVFSVIGLLMINRFLRLPVESVPPVDQGHPEETAH